MSHRMMWGRKGSGLPYTPPLDAANAAAAYGIRKLRTDYNGPCVRVSDTAGFSGSTKDVGFDSNGFIDVSELYSVSYLRTWYDHTGNGRDLVQNTVGRTPIMYRDNTSEWVNGKVAIKFLGDDFLSVPSSTGIFKFLHDGTKCQVVSVNQFGVSADPGVLMVLLATCSFTGEVGVILSFRDAFGSNNAYQGAIYRGVGGSPTAEFVSADNAIPPNEQILFWNEFDGNNATAADRIVGQVNDAALISGNANTNAPSTSNTTRDLNVGRTPNDSFSLTGFLQELIVYDTDQSAQKTTLQNNLNDYFSIY